MDLRKLSSLLDEQVTVHKKENQEEKTSGIEFLAKVSDSISGNLPNKFSERNRFVKDKIFSILQSTDMDSEFMTPVCDSIIKLLGLYESRVTAIQDSFVKSKAQCRELSEKVAELSDKRRKLQSIVDSYQRIASVSEFKRRLADADYVIQTKEAAQQKAEEAKQNIENQQKSLEQQQKQYEENQKRLEQQQQQMEQQRQQMEQQRQQMEQQQREFEEKQKQLEEQRKQLEEQNKNQTTVNIQNQSDSILQIQDDEDSSEAVNNTEAVDNTEKDNAGNNSDNSDNNPDNTTDEGVLKESSSNSEGNYTKENVNTLASQFEDWLQSGSAFLATKLNTTAQTINDPKLVELVQKATNYEPIPKEEYDNLTSNLQKALEANGVSIPSLSFIQDSFMTENLKKMAKPTSKVQGAVIFQAVQNYVLDPNDENKKILTDYTEGLSKSSLKQRLIELVHLPTVLEYYEPGKLDAIVQDIKPLVKDKEFEMCVPLRCTYEFNQSKTEGIDNEILEPVLSHPQFQYLSDSRIKQLFKIASKINDCDCSGCCSLGHDFMIDGITPMEIDGYVMVTINGVAHPYVIKPEYQNNIAASIEEVRRKCYEPNSAIQCLNEKFVPLDCLISAADCCEAYDVLSDSVLYKRHLTDSYWVSDTMSANDFKKVLKKLTTIIDSVEGYRKLSSIDGDRKVRLIVSDSVLPDSDSFTSIAPTEKIDIESTKRKIQLLLQ